MRISGHLEPMGVSHVGTMLPGNETLVTQQIPLHCKSCSAAAINTHCASVKYETHPHAGANAGLAAIASRGLHDDAVVRHVI